MDPWIAKAIVVAASLAMIVIRAPHGQRSRTVKVIKHGKGTRETILLTLAWIGFFVPLIWVFSPGTIRGRIRGVHGPHTPVSSRRLVIETRFR